jgi:hypothetical protein
MDRMEIIAFNGWERNVRLTNGTVDVVVSCEVGPRVLRFGFVDGPNVFAEIEGQQGGTGEDEWMIRGGHRLWVAPEDRVLTYEPDNGPVEVEAIANGIRTLQPTGSVSGIRKTMDITLAPDTNTVSVTHTLCNEGEKPVELAPWALSVMAPGGMAVIPLPEPVPHSQQLTPNQLWSIWSYTDLGDPRWTLGDRYVFLRQDTGRGPTKLGMVHRQGWVAYQLGGNVFIKRFAFVEGARYPDGGVNFETFTNQEFLELESLGPLVHLSPGKTVRHEETWQLHGEVPACRDAQDADRHIAPLAANP